MMSDETTKDRLYFDLLNIRSDIEFLQKIFEDPFITNESTLSSQDWLRLVELIPDMAYQDYPDVWFAFVDTSLEIKVTADIDISSAGKQRQSLNTVTVVLTTGGPHIELVADCKHNRLELRGYWSTESCTVQVDAPGLYGHLDFYGSEMLSIR